MLSLNIMLFSEDQLKKVYYRSTYNVSRMTDIHLLAKKVVTQTQVSEFRSYLK